MECGASTYAAQRGKEALVVKPAALVTTLFLSLIAVAHLLRIMFQVAISVSAGTAGPWVIPMWASALAFVGPGALALWLWREQSR
jgi:hypothetical protein